MKKNLFFLFCLLIINIFLWQVIFQITCPYFQVTFLDVGQGDSIFLRTPQNHYILIDGGSSSKVLEHLDKKIPFFKNNIDLVILTHAHDDHYLGLIDVFQRYKVNNFLWNGVETKASSFLKLQELVKDSNIIIAKKEQRIRAGFVFLEVLHPVNSEQIKDLNNTSVVTKVSFKNNSFLFTGDIYQEIEKELENIDSDVLQIAHHGSKTSTSEEFLRLVNPKYAIISVGKDNSYGHPHDIVLKRIQKYDIFVLRTDLLGNINFFSDGEKLEIKI
ncbi:MAG: ComEC/Rec2 family competence protein [Candidatus Pacebacteria bacterium]|nr:ComEC/Rec2 family competence protein [Candidatus Paceibacterota bacterium]